MVITNRSEPVLHALSNKRVLPLCMSVKLTWFGVVGCVDLVRIMLGSSDVLRVCSDHFLVW